MQYIGDIKFLERIQRRWTRAVSGLSDLPYSERLRRLDLFSYQGCLLRSDLMWVWKIMQLILLTYICSFANYDNTKGHHSSKENFPSSRSVGCYIEFFFDQSNFCLNLTLP